MDSRSGNYDTVESVLYGIPDIEKPKNSFKVSVWFSYERGVCYICDAKLPLERKNLVQCENCTKIEIKNFMRDYGSTERH